MKKLTLALGIFCHMPVGSDSDELNSLYHACLRPLIASLKKNPDIKISLRLSGIFLDWVLKRHPGIMARLRGHCQEGRIEMLGGGYYDPILPMIPKSDRLGQIHKLNDALRERTGLSPDGFWPAAQVWDPCLIHAVHQSKMKYALLDYAHFLRAGFNQTDLCGYFVTEEMGESIYLIPTHNVIRGQTDFSSLASIRPLAQNASNAEMTHLSLMVHPHQNSDQAGEQARHTYLTEWKSLFDFLHKESSWLKTIHFSDVLNKCPFQGVVRIPSSSTESKLDDVKDWRQVFNDYPEINNTQKRMLLISQSVAKAEGKIPQTTFKKAQTKLWAGQCGSAYWPGSAQEYFRPQRRHRVVKELITSRRIIDEATKLRRNWVDCRVFDFNGDGLDEIVLESRRLNLYFSLVGGQLIVFDDRRLGFNFLNIILPRHRKKDRSQCESFQRPDSDRFPAKSLTDHFFAPDMKFDLTETGPLDEIGDFFNQPYSYRWQQKGNNVVLMLEGNGEIKLDDHLHPIRIEKTVQLVPDRPVFDLDVKLESKGKSDIQFYYGLGFKLPLLNENDGLPLLRIRDEDSNSRIENRGHIQSSVAVTFSYPQEKILVTLENTPSVEFIFWPICIESSSQEREKKIFQGVSNIFLWKINLEKRTPMRLKMKIRIDKMA